MEWHIETGGELLGQVITKQDTYITVMFLCLEGFLYLFIRLSLNSTLLEVISLKVKEFRNLLLEIKDLRWRNNF
jgi:hypothetical protein